MEKANNMIYNQNQVLRRHLSQLDTFETLSVFVDMKDFQKPDFNTEDAERLKPFEDFLEPIQKFKDKPCVYFIEIVTGNPKEIRAAYEQLDGKNKAGLRKIDEKIFDTQCLYVGKSQKSIVHRLKVHFGYKNTSEKGLQLLHWAIPLHLKLKIHIYCFPTELDFLLPSYEKVLNKELKPLIGYL